MTKRRHRQAQLFPEGSAQSRGKHGRAEDELAWAAALRLRRNGYTVMRQGGDFHLIRPKAKLRGGDRVTTAELIQRAAAFVTPEEIARCR